jgi:Adenylate and Guanylate cyclase catalytic domain/MAP3K TRAFs-binding domain
MNGPTDDTAQATAIQAEEFLRRGEPLLAYNRVQIGLQRWPDDTRLRQLQALALARGGDVERANRILATLAAEGLDDAETLGILARTHKDLALAAKGIAQRASHVAAAFRLYECAFESARDNGATDGAIYAGINAATMAVLMGDLGKARGIAAEVRAICERSGAASGNAAQYWNEATLGEAALILGDPASATVHYGAAAKLGHARFGDLSSTRRQARLLAAHLPGEGNDIADMLCIPPVLVFTGNMIDQPGRTSPRFPTALESTVRAAMRERLASLSPLAVYASAACGADILCLELAREMGSETHVVLPFPPEEFRRASVDIAGDNWGPRFDTALAAADSVTITSDHRASGSAATFEYANLVLTGMGQLRSQALDTTLRALAVWDPGVGAPGGSASLVTIWEARALPVDHVRLPALRGDLHATAASVAQEATTEGTRHEMRAMLFADAVGYSQLSEDQIPTFIANFLGAVANLNTRTAHRFEHVETSGDGLYMVFGNVADAAHYALELSAMTNAFDWVANGLPSTMNLRVALHCGPVHCGRDPVTGSALYTGPHTSRTARIEPITPPGQVYASSAFAAVAAASGVEGIAMHYVGRIPLAKGYGTLGLYNVRRA